MNPKIFVAAAVVAMAVAVGALALSSQSVTSGIPGSPAFDGSPQVEPIRIELDGISVSEINERSASIDVSLVFTNPNPKSVILQFVKYELFADGTRIHAGEIGERPEGMVQFSSNYFTLLTDTPITLSDTVTVRNSGGAPDIWRTLSDGSVDLDIRGDAFFNLSSITAGGENEVSFAFG